MMDIKVERDRLQELIDEANGTAIDVVNLRDNLLRFRKLFYGGKYTNRLYEIQFPYFFKAMVDEMDKHWAAKGDSYHECEVDYMEEILFDAIEAYKKLDFDHPRKAHQTVDIANICAMLYQRLCGI